ncbi:hypothetical protein F511_37699 [Dorcoceras hygrometricum]|uniref:Uncharacterized protein n=1 Tax=Dorcoceras hygrometricum TaxID=472368 RepID=A0A2Z7D1X0_9LAMI|nr:hypothetical protein F511_37699 [Dorcoceras hygrometricum]
MSLFDLQDVCIVIGSLATLDLPMVVALIGIYVLKGPYCTLTTTNWFLQALSVIPRGSWRDVARRFTMIRWASDLKNCFHIIILSFGNCVDLSDRIGDRDYDEATVMEMNLILQVAAPPSPPHLAAADRPSTAGRRRRRPILRVVGLVPTSVTRRFPSVPNSSGLLVQADEGLVFPIVDLIRRIYRRLHLKSQILCEFGWSQAPRRQQVDWAVKMKIRPPEHETSICDAKYRVPLSTRSVLGKCVYLVTLAMSLFDLQDVRIAIGSIATLDLPMVVDLIGIYGLKGPYCALTTTNWFL